MGWIHKGLEKANNLQIVAQNLQNYALQRKRDIAKQRLQQVIAGALGGYDDLEQKQKQQTTDFIPGIPGQTTGKIIPYNKFNKEYISTRSDEIQTDFMKNLLSIEDVDDASVIKSMKMVEMLGKRFMTEPDEIIKLNKGQTAIGLNKKTGDIKELYTAPDKDKDHKQNKFKRYEIDEKTKKEKIYNIGGKDYLKEEEYLNDAKTGNYEYKPIGSSSNNNIYIDLGKDLESLKDYPQLATMIEYAGVDPETGLPVERSAEDKKKMQVALRESARGLLRNSNAYAWYQKKFMDKRTDKNKSYAWGREDVSKHDFLAEIIEARDKNEISTDAYLDLERFANYREKFWDLDTNNYKKVK